MLSLTGPVATLIGMTLIVMMAFGFYAGVIFLGEFLLVMEAVKFLRRVGRVFRWARA